PLIGFFVNSLVLRVNTEFKYLPEFLAHIRKVNLDAQENQDIPFEQVVEHCKVIRSAKHSPMFQIMLSMDSVENESAILSGVKFKSKQYKRYAAKFDLTLNILNTNGLLQFNWLYDKSIFEKSRIELLNSHLQRLLLGIAENPQSKIVDLPILSSKEIYYLVNELNNTKLDFRQDLLIHEIFEENAKLRPDNTAIVFDKENITYLELNEKANQLAHYLRRKGVGAETIVGICLHRSIELMIGVLGVLKSGGAYLPLDPNYPEQRLKFMIEDSNASFIVTQKDLMSQLPIENKTLILMDKELFNPLYRGFPINDIDRKVTNLKAANLAYIIYTSGSSGLAKGVQVEHNSLINLVYSLVKRFNLSHKSRVLQLSSFSFDAATWDWSMAFAMGSQLHLLPEQKVLSPTALGQLVKENKITYSFVPPALLASLSLDDFEGVETITIGGESPDAGVVQKWSSGRMLYNAYGPTENTVVATIANLSDSKGAVSIGKPINNVECFVLDQALEVLPFGTIGELYIGGSGLARGYLNRPELTRERFITNPFSDNPSDRLYKTGDLVRYLPDGNLEFIGRQDEQIKLRGFRIELGEIEYHLSQCDDVASCVVLAKSEDSGEKALVAYLVPTEIDTLVEQDYVSKIREKLRKLLPDYMVPAYFVLLEKLPLTTNGKIDKKSLPAPDGTVHQGKYLAANTKTEEVLVSIWSKLLKLESDSISVTADFFDLGGHSLLAVRLIAEIRTQLQKDLVVKEIFESTTVREIAKTIDAITDKSTRLLITPVTRESNYLPLSFAQQSVWFIDQLEGGSSQYNMPMGLHIEGAFDVAAAEQALTRMIQRHEVLRTVFVERDAEPMQVIKEAFDFKLNYHDLTRLDKSQQASRVVALVKQDSQLLFDLRRDLMVRVSYLYLSGKDANQQGVLLFNMHHIASDGWSMGILVNEFVQQYQSVLNGESNQFSALPLQYSDYAHWQREWLSGELLERQLTYWKTHLDDIPAVHSLPLDYPRPEMKKHAGGLIRTRLSSEISNRLEQVARKSEVTLFMLLHAALALVVSRHSNSQDIVIGTPVANRLQAELEPLIGFFVNTLVLRVDTAHEYLSDYLAHVKQVNLDAQTNQDVPF
ncbi:MAG: amino acid adenylation domain-containing protein, partial [Kangiellaceae bacterium]|nr:amino acid adenylation domain-containing protein [Kangiellaceae bacterium]